VIFTTSQSIGFASNSYTIWEDEILLFFVTSFGVIAVITSLRQPTMADRFLGCYQSILFVFFARLASFSRLCREEQMPFCRSTYYASANSSTSATWQLCIPFAVTLILPSIIKSYYQSTRSYEGAAPLFIGIVFRIALLLVAIFWLVDAADDGDWYPSPDKTVMKTLRMSIAQVVLGLSLAAGTTYFIYARPCVSILTSPSPSKPSRSITKSLAAATPNPPSSTITILGYANTHGTLYLLLPLTLFLTLLLVQKPMGHSSLALLLLQILSLLDILSASPTLSTSPIGPILLAMLGNYHFFKTGHQSTLASIQWESAFIPLRAITYPWSPMLVVANTFGAQILTATAVPLVVLWKRDVKRKGILGEVAKAITTFLTYHATIGVATTVGTGWLRRHLMLYRIFAPRWMVASGVLLVVDVVVVVVGLGGVAVSVSSVGEVFGWP
jgi:phosphatidylinositol glycan class O